MLIAAMLVRYLHIIFGITWFGGTVYRSLIVLPALGAISPREQRPILQSLQEGHETFLLTTGLIVIILGILLGAVVGPIQSGEAVFSWYGLTWLGSFLFSAILL